MNQRKALLGLGILGLFGAVLFFSGCEEEDVGSIFGSESVRATKVEARGMEFEAPLSLEVETTNGSVAVQGVAGIQTVSVTITLWSRGQTLEAAQDRVDRIVYHTEQLGNRINLLYRPNEQDDDVQRYSGVAFDVLVPMEAQVRVDTSNGEINIGRIQGTIALDTSNGAIEVYDSTGVLTANTSNGRIEVVRFSGDIHLGSSNGEMWLEQVSGLVDAETSNGSVRYTGNPTAAGNRIRTSNGSITVRVPLDASIAFHAGTSSGKIHSSLPLLGDTQGDEWSAQLNPPAEVLFDLRTSNGTIRIEGL